jgi:hypothetical protein
MTETQRILINNLRSFGPWLSKAQRQSLEAILAELVATLTPPPRT